MKKNFYGVLKIFNNLKISLLTAIAIMASANAVTAKPLCYMIDANGQRISLGHLCGGTKKTASTTQATTTDTSSSTPIDEPSVPILEDEASTSTSEDGFPEEDTNETQAPDVGIVGGNDNKRRLEIESSQQQAEKMDKPEIPKWRNRYKRYRRGQRIDR
jgi:hypothetical protein